MSSVEPIRSRKSIRKIEKILFNNKRDLLLFTMGINTGLRISDLLLLNVESVRGKNFIQLREKKTGKLKFFPINSKLKVMIRNYTYNHNYWKPLFKTKFGNRMSRFTAYNIITTVCKKANIDGVF